MIRNILRYAYRYFLPRRISRSVDLFKELRTPRVEGLKEKNILVLSPHPDDDIIGCGGTLHIYHQNGAEVTSVYLTDGRKGNPGGYKEDELVSIRKEEAKKAAKIIGIDKLIFLDHRDSELSSNPETAKQLSEILEDLKPDAIFLPFLLDNHADHITTNDIFVRSTKAYSDSVICYGYEVWTPMTAPNCIVDITGQLQVKKMAIEQHHSQLVKFDFIDAITGLSRYRSVLHNLTDGYAEAFSRCNIREYRRLWQVIR